MSFILLVEQTAPETPSANQVVLYPKADGLIYSKDDTGAERAMAASAAATTDNAVARFDGIAGALQNSLIIVSDTGAITGILSINNADLGTPTACVATNFTGTASGLTAGAVTALGTPASGVLTNCTGLPQAGLTSAAVGQAQLKTTTGDMTTIAVSSFQTGPGGEYGFWPTVMTTGSDVNTGRMAAPLSAVSADAVAQSLIIGTSLLQRFHIGEDSSTDTLTVRQRYVQASPPYDLGDGEVPLFIFVIISSLGVIESVWTAPDPVWANNGPTNIRPDLIDAQGRAFKFERPKLDRALLLNPATRDAELAKLDAEPQLVEITQAMKQADMPLIPHPFQGNNLTGKTVVLLDPVSALTERLLRIHQTGESVNGLLHDDFLRVGNVPLVRAGPPSVMCVAPKWRLT